MKVLKIAHSFVCLLVVITGMSTARAQDVDGVFGLAPMPDGAAMAVWVPLSSVEAVSGVRWFNNDGSKVFPEVLAVAGDSAYPSQMSEAVQVGSDVAGSTLGWSEIAFPQALASATPGLFLIFKLPPDGVFVAEGEGCGLGYQIGDGQIRCWVATESDEWSQLSPEYQMAVIPIMNSNKSSDVLVLGSKDSKLNSGEKPSLPTTAALHVGPNPFNPSTIINYSLPKDADVTLEIFDVRGRKIVSLVAGWQTAGRHTVTWEGFDGKGNPQPSGVYLAQMRAGAIHMSCRMTLLK
jgi:hypothetical protein